VKRGALVLQFDNRAGSADLVVGQDYQNAAGETFRINRLNYFISNIILVGDNGVYRVPADSSYFLIREEDAASQTVRLNNIPADRYTSIRFTIGVDSLRSTMDIAKRTGVLDPTQGEEGMYWTWNSGYIFFKMEGTSPAAPPAQDNRFVYHIGGFGGYDTPTLNNIRVATLPAVQGIEVVEDGATTVTIQADVLKVFQGPSTFSIANYPTVMFAPFSTSISENYSRMFSMDQITNN